MIQSTTGVRVALVHDYLTQMGGAERVLLALHDLYPSAPIYTSLYAPQAVDQRFQACDIRTTGLARIPFGAQASRALLPLYPLTFPRIDLRGYDVVISSSSAFAKSVHVPAGTTHICYCHTPMRWAWNYNSYMAREQLGALPREVLRPYVAWLRRWDSATANRVSYFVANSATVAQRIARCYRRDALVVPPPVDTGRYELTSKPGDHYLVVSRLVPYKRIDLAVEAFSRLGLPLLVIGDGRDAGRLRRLAGPNVRFLGRLPDSAVHHYMARCRALVFPGAEDFGLTPVEAMASGRPVIAYGAGGALESVVDGQTGLFFTSQTVESLTDAVRRCEAMHWEPGLIRKRARQFDTRLFQQRMRTIIEEFSVAQVTQGSTSPAPTHTATLREVAD